MTRYGKLFVSGYLSFSTNSISKHLIMYDATMIRLASANVLPKQVRLPPLNASQLIGFRFDPLGVRNSGLELSNLSG